MIIFVERLLSIPIRAEERVLRVLWAVEACEWPRMVKILEFFQRKKRRVLWWIEMLDRKIENNKKNVGTGTLSTCAIFIGFNGLSVANPSSHQLKKKK